MPLTCLRRQREPGGAEGAGSFGPLRQPDRAGHNCRAAVLRRPIASVCRPRDVRVRHTRIPEECSRVCADHRQRRRKRASGAGADDRRRPVPEDRAVVVARSQRRAARPGHPLADGDSVEPVGVDEEDGLNVLRHSAAHVLAQAVQEVHPKARLGIGPPSRTASTTTSTSRSRSTRRPQAAREGHAAHHQRGPDLRARREITDAEALAELKDEPYKCELIGLKGGSAETAAEGALRRGRRGPAHDL